MTHAVTHEQKKRGGNSGTENTCGCGNPAANPLYSLESLRKASLSNLHEMVHLYCREHGAKEVSRGGKYHNGRFKAEAERRGLTCVPCGQYGWNTTPGDNLVEYALSKGWNEIKIGRASLPPMIRTGAGGAPQTGAETAQGGKRPSSTRKLVCPKCGQSVRATRKVNILCGDCMLSMVEV